MYPRLNVVSFTNYSFDQQSYTEERNGSLISDEILKKNKNKGEQGKYDFRNLQMQYTNKF